MVNGRKIGLTIAQMLVGCCAGVIAGGISLSLVNLMWRGIKSVNPGGFLTALLLLVSFLLVYGVAVVATAEGVRQMGRFISKQAARKRVYEGSFLGACAAVAVLTVTRADWITTLEEWGGPIKLLGTLVYFVLVIPVKFGTYWIPPLLVLLIAAPIGAAIACNVSPTENESSQAETSEEQNAGKKGGKKT